MINVGVWFESFGNFAAVNYGASDFRTWAAVKQNCWVPAKEKQQRLEEKKEMVG
jgi:hypothetical protein